jgi:16S rRNA (guanine966-N2)-methyltransferase
MKSSSNTRTGGKARAKVAPSASHPGEVRIIGGLWKRSKLKVDARAGLRPTPDRVRETLFNWLGQDLAGWHCLDAFAGSGALGFEAASRGAASVLLVEQDAALVVRLQDAKVRLKAETLQVQRGDALMALDRTAPESLDLVFLDPPFDSKAHEAALKSAARALKAQGWLYLEAPRLWSEEELGAFGLQTHRHLKAGAVHAHLLRKTP